MLSFTPARSWLWRLGRKMYQYARLEGKNDPRCNGEYRLLDAVIEQARGPLSLLDVGANRGDWSCAALECLSRHGQVGTVHAFEPTSSSVLFLERRFAGEQRLQLQPLALSDRRGPATLYVVGELAGLNSLVDLQIGAPTHVETTTVDVYLDQRGLERVTFLKSDTEGHDLAVLRGGSRALADGRIDAWQFEYNARWIHDRAFLRDVFELVRDKPYVLGKLHRRGVELFDEWHPELERYFETNFVLLRRGTALERLGQGAHFDRSNVAVRARRR